MNSAFVPFSRAPFWNTDTPQGAEGLTLVPLPQKKISTPALAEEWAALIVACWQDVVDQQSQSSEAEPPPFFLLQPMANDDGQFAFWLINKLRDSMEAKNWGRDFHYLLHVPVLGTGEATGSLPLKLRPLLQEGLLQLIEWDVQNPLASLPSSNCSHLTLVANGCFSRMPSTLYGFDKGSMDLGFIASQVRQPEYRWTPLADSHWKSLPRIAKHSLNAYRGSLYHSSAFYPEVVISLLETLRSTHPDLLVLSQDQGIANCRAVAMEGLPTASQTGELQIPVNFDCLKRACAWSHGNSWMVSLPDNDHVQWVGLFGRKKGRSWVQAKAALNTWQNRKGTSTAASFYLRMLQQAEKFEARDIPLLMKAAQDDPSVFFACLLKVNPNEFETNVKENKALCQSLSRVWAFTFPTQGDADNYFALGCTALRLRHWPIAIQSFRAYLYFQPQSVPGWFYLSVCLRVIGLPQEALVQLRHALALDPENDEIQKQLEHSEQLQREWESLPWYHPNLAQKGKLLLEPLSFHHLPDLLQQYRDPSIRALTRSFIPKDLENAEKWLKALKDEENRIVFAVVHQEFGFVGLCGAKCGERSGHFYFWIGTDYQDQGFGIDAASLTLQQLQAYGLKHLYTTIFPYNRRSQKALEKVGFQYLPFDWELPGDPMLFYGLTWDPDFAIQKDRSELDRLQNEIQALTEEEEAQLSEQKKANHPLPLETDEACILKFICAYDDAEEASGSTVFACGRYILIVDLHPSALCLEAIRAFIDDYQEEKGSCDIDLVFMHSPPQVLPLWESSLGQLEIRTLFYGGKEECTINWPRVKIATHVKTGIQTDVDVYGQGGDIQCAIKIWNPEAWPDCKGSHSLVVHINTDIPTKYGKTGDKEVNILLTGNRTKSLAGLGLEAIAWDVIKLPHLENYTHFEQTLPGALPGRFNVLSGHTPWEGSATLLGNVQTSGNVFVLTHKDVSRLQSLYDKFNQKNAYDRGTRLFAGTHMQVVVNQEGDIHWALDDCDNLLNFKRCA